PQGTAGDRCAAGPWRRSAGGADQREPHSSPIGPLTDPAMPMRYRIDSERGMLFVGADGDTTQAERVQAMQAWIRDPDFRPGLQTLADFSEATNVPTLAELEEIVDYMRRYATTIGQKRIAMVTSRPVSFGVARQFGAL